MKMISILNKIKNVQEIDKKLVTELYSLSRMSLIVLFLLTILITMVLKSGSNNGIVLWSIVLNSIVFLRFFTAYQFKSNIQRYSIMTWYKIFLVLSLSTAFIASILGFYFLHYFDTYLQLFIVTALLGLASGSIVSLRPDTRIAITYLGIIILPLIVSLNFVDTVAENHAISFILMLYYIGLVSMLLKTQKEHNKHKIMREEKNILQNIFKEAPLGIFMYDKNFKVTDCNDELGNLFNHELKNIIGMNLKDVADSSPLSIFKNSFSEGSNVYKGPYVSLQGNHFWIEAKAFSFSDKSSSIGTIEDKTKEHTALKKLEYLVEHDVLTGLLNRRGFTNYIESLVKDVKHQTHYSILFYLDLNQFKSINDSLGHGVGDEVLLSVSKRLVNFLQNKCMVSRLGGDEFIIILPYTSTDKEITNTNAKKCSKEIQDIFSKPFDIQEMQLHVQSSMGIVFLEPKYTNTEEVLRHADLTMYQAKNTNTHISYYDASLDEKQKELFILQHNLAYAAQNEQFELFFQPIVKMKDESLRSAELLIRWNHPTRGLLSPEDFIPLAIKVGLLSKITWWIIDSVCQQIEQWKKDGHWKLEYISININPTQLTENHFAAEFFKKLKHYNVQTCEIMIEITERSLIDNFSNTQGVINDLRSHGIKCAIDDFGIGYSSLSYLKKLSFHTLKIDRTFVKDIGQTPKELIMINTILDIGRLFNYNIVIEGIENEQQKKALLELDSELSYQGYYYSKPIKANEFTKKFLA